MKKANLSLMALSLTSAAALAQTAPAAAPESTLSYNIGVVSEYRYRGISQSSRNPAVLGRLKAIAAWRETEAMDKNIPRGRIMRDETLADVASHPPREQHDLAKVRGLSAGWKDNDIGRRLMQAIADAKPLPDAELPARAPRGAPLGKEGALVADLLKLLLKIRSREIDIASRLLARSDDLEALAAGQRKGNPLLEGWRFEQFGRDALELVEGKLAFAVVKGRLKMAHIDDIAGSGEDAPAPEPVVDDEDGFSPPDAGDEVADGDGAAEAETPAGTGAD